jgi:LmbE family N-acetylglucosaminyl deacetylase
MTGIATGSTASSPIQCPTADPCAGWPQLEPGAAVLVLTDASRADSFGAYARDATVLTDVASLDGVEEAQFDAAVVDGLLEDEPWDRWALQRIHRVLRLDATIVVIVPPLTTLASAADVRFWAYAFRQVLRRLVKLWRPELEVPGVVHRRYHLPWLVRKLESVGYTAIAAGPGWQAGEASAGSPWLARRATVTARKAASMAGLHGRSWPEAATHRRRYEEQTAAVSAARDAWLSDVPEYRGLTPRALEPSEWRRANVLVLAPHPDDELIGCGGTLCRILSDEARASILLATDGSRLESLYDLPKARRRTIRLEEASRVASALGAELVLWRKEDARLQRTDELVRKLADLLGELDPSHIFTPFLGDMHADHRALSRILGEALALSRGEPQVLQYEVWGLVPVNLYCDITDQVETLERLLFLYERAMRVQDFVHFCESRNLARALEVAGRPAYAEAFLSTTSKEYLRLIARTA